MYLLEIISSDRGRKGIYTCGIVKSDEETEESLQESEKECKVNDEISLLVLEEEEENNNCGINSSSYS
jgi:hypothetical protein